jgi:predicted nuclease with RNAse H fold
MRVTRLIGDLRSELGHAPVAVGIDLAASEKRKTGWACLRGAHSVTGRLETDDEIVAESLSMHPHVVSIDAPLGLPKGRDCVRDDCQCRRFGIMRESGRELRKRGIHVFPCLLPSMQSLTLRGMNLRKRFEKEGLNVIESYPGAAQDILRLPRKQVGVEKLRAGLASLGITGASNGEKTSHDELDAITSALVGYFYMCGKYEALGNAEEGYLIIPHMRSRIPTS